MRLIKLYARVFCSATFWHFNAPFYSARIVSDGDNERAKFTRRFLR